MLAGLTVQVGALRANTTYRDPYYCTACAGCSRSKRALYNTARLPQHAVSCRMAASSPPLPTSWLQEMNKQTFQNKTTHQGPAPPQGSVAASASGPPPAAPWRSAGRVEHAKEHGILGGRAEGARSGHFAIDNVHVDSRVAWSAAPHALCRCHCPSLAEQCSHRQEQAAVLRALLHCNSSGPDVSPSWLAAGLASHTCPPCKLGPGAHRPHPQTADQRC